MVMLGGYMSVYNFYQDIGYISATVYLLVCGVLLGIVIWQCVVIGKILFAHSLKIKLVEVLVRFAVTTITLIPLFFCSNDLVSLGTKIYRYHTEQYDIESGLLDNLIVERKDYRDDEQYRVLFDVNNITFKPTNMILDEQTLRMLSSVEHKNVKIAYENSEEGIFIHFIEICND